MSLIHLNSLTIWDLSSINTDMEIKVDKYQTFQYQTKYKNLKHENMSRAFF